MRDFKPESHDLVHRAALGASGAGAALLVIALLSPHTRGLIVGLAVSLTAYLAWQVAWFARHRVVPLPGGPYAVTDTVEAHVARVGHLERRFDTPSRE